MTEAPIRKGITVKGFLISLGVGILAAGGGLIPFMGLPGMVVFLLFLPITTLFLGNATIDADAMWPIAILVTLFWPISFPVAYLVSWGAFARRSRRFKWLIMIGITLVWGLVLAFYCVATAPKE